MLFRKKRLVPPIAPKEELELERLTQEEWKGVAEYKEKIAKLEAEIDSHPKTKDFVRILINDVRGQLIDGSYPQVESRAFSFYDFVPPRNELERLIRQYNKLVESEAYYQSSFRWSVRLNNGYIIRELRPWEIAKVNDR